MNDDLSLPSAPSRRDLLTAGAWSVPVIALAGAAPHAAASPRGSGWVAAVRISNGVTNPSSAPGFRFGQIGANGLISVTVQFTSSESGLRSTDVFNTFGTAWSGWTWTQSGGPDTHTYSWSGSLTVGPSAFDDAAAVPGSTTGITIKGRQGSYSATVTSNSGTPLPPHSSAGLAYPLNP